MRGYAWDRLVMWLGAIVLISVLVSRLIESILDVCGL